ncbi:unnamed protein product [Protopolystoma xenopodis]|uniref:Uncharacterized protein n=1 Tax=Protopolystoma xenopodis TaxID=117903 RepID=A0A448WAR8_9PLAT|nr:unnamed protein product [Protopolystoma xenopodis]
MLPRFDDVRHMTDESLAPFLRNGRRLPQKRRQHESSSKANRQLVKRIQPSSSGGTEPTISSPNTSTRKGSKLNHYETRDSSKHNFSSLNNYVKVIGNVNSTHIIVGKINYQSFITLHKIGSTQLIYLFFLLHILIIDRGLIVS